MIPVGGKMKTIVDILLGFVTGLVPVVNIRYIVSHVETPDPTPFEYGVLMGMVSEAAALLIFLAVASNPYR